MHKPIQNNHPDIESSCREVAGTDYSVFKAPGFSTTEYARRVAAVQKLMAGAGLDVVLCHDLSNICYLTGFQTIGSYGYGHYAVIIPIEGSPTLFSSDFESHNARVHSCIDPDFPY